MKDNRRKLHIALFAAYAALMLWLLLHRSGYVNGIPYLQQMKANLKAGGLDASFVDSLSRADLISAVQMAVWTFANTGDSAANGLNYFATVSVLKNQGKYFTALRVRFP